MAIEHIGAAPTQNNIKTSEIKFNAPPLEKKEVKGNGNKLLYGALAGLATLTAAGVAIYKLKGGKPVSSIKNLYPQGIPNEENGIKYFFKNGKLYDECLNYATTVLNRTSSRGHTLETHYKDGEVVKRIFKPARNSNTDIEYISKIYQTSPAGNKYINEEIAKRGREIEHRVRIKKSKGFDNISICGGNKIMQE